MATMAPSRPELLSLLRSLLRTAGKLSDYNICEYARHRGSRFGDNRGLSDASSKSAVIADGMAQLEVAERQAVVYSLYAHKVRSVMEIKGL